MGVTLKRYIAAYIDLFIAVIISVAIFKYLIREESKIIIYIGVIFAVFLYLLKDIFGRSIGKRLLGLKIVDKNNYTITPQWWRLILHNMTLPIWLIDILYMNSHVSGEKPIDKLLNIKVIELHPKIKKYDL